MSVSHVSTTEIWFVEHKGTKFTVRRWDHWPTGEQEWRVFVDDDHGMRRVVEGEELHEVVRIVQQHLVTR